MSAGSLIQLGLQQFWRELRNTDLRLFFISIFLVMTSVTTIQVFTSKVNLALVRQSSNFIGADQMIRQPEAIPAKWYTKANELDLQSTGYTMFPSMLAYNDEIILSGIKGVQPGYPLRGSLRISSDLDSIQQETNSIPEAGTIWLEPALAEQLGAVPGDQIDFGAISLDFTQYIRYEPDRNATFFAFIPRALVRYSDLQKAGVLLRGSRVTHAFLYAGESDSVATMFDWLEDEKHANARAIDPRDDSRGIGRTLSRAEEFLILAGLLITLLCGIGIALASQRYTLLRSRHMAVYKTLGMTSRQILFLIIVQLGGILVLSLLLSSVVGWLLQELLVSFVRSLFKVELPKDFSVLIFLDSFFTGLVAVVAFALPDFIRLTKVPAMHILRASNQQFSSRFSFVPGMLGMLVLTIIYSDSLLLSVTVFAGMILCWLLASLITKILISSGSNADNFWSLLLARMGKRKMHYGLQTVVFSLCILFGLMLLLVRTSLLENWREQTPKDAINKMLVNIGIEQQQQLANRLESLGINQEIYYPIVRGRFVRINDLTAEQAAEITQTDADEHERELSLTFQNDLPENVDIIEGSWWTDVDQSEDRTIARISVEKHIADSYNVSLGDIITFRIGASEIDARVASIRKVNWGEFKPNFYIIFEPSWLEQFPYTYMTGVYVSDDNRKDFNAIIKSFGNVSVFSAEMLLERIRQLINQVSKAIEAILALLVVAGIVVVITSVRSTLDERLHEYTLMRTFGASFKEIMQLVIIEFVILGAISGILGTIGAELISWYLHKQIFDMDYIWTPTLWLLGPLAGVLLIGLSGTISCLPSVRLTPVAMLRKILN